MSIEDKHWREFFKSDYLGAADLEPGEERALTIKTVRERDVPIPGSPKKDRKLTIEFMESGAKPMVVNVTNSRAISKLAGSGVLGNWVGQRIIVYQSMTKFKGEDTDCLRVHEYPPTDAPKELPALTPEHAKWAGAVASLREGRITLDGIRQYFSVGDEVVDMLTAAAQEAQGAEA